MEVSIGQQARTRNLPSIVDGFAIGDSEIRTWGNKIIQVDNGTAGLPKKSMHLESVSRASRGTHYLAP